MPLKKLKAPVPVLKGKKPMKEEMSLIKIIKFNETPLTIPPQHYNKQNSAEVI
jgi:hypothetical protein